MRHPSADFTRLAADPLAAPIRAARTTGADRLGRVFDSSLGVLLAGVAIIVTLCLISWSATDPSISNLSAERPRNWLGTPGALLSDATFQTLGLAGIFAVLPLAYWAVELLSGRGIENFRLKVILAPVAVVLLAAAFAALPTVGTWPLKSGLGGLLGDMLLNLAVGIVATVNADRASVVAGLGFTVGGFALLVQALGLTATDLADLVRKQIRVHLPDSSWVSHLKRSAHVPLDERFADAAPTQPPEPREAPEIQVQRPAAQPAPIAPRVVAAAPPPPAVAPAEAARPVTWSLPPLDLLPKSRLSSTPPAAHHAMQRLRAEQLAALLATYSVRADVKVSNSGPILTTFVIEPAAATKPARLIGLADDIARGLGVTRVRALPIPGRNAVAIEVPHGDPVTIGLADVIGNPDFANATRALPLGLGATAAGELALADLAELQHVLIGGGTSAARSGVFNALVASLLYRSTPADLRLVLIDPTGHDLAALRALPQVERPVARTPEAAAEALAAVCADMKRRADPMTRVVLVACSDALVGNDIAEAALREIASRGAQFGVHVIATVDQPHILAGSETLRGLFATRIALAVASKQDSRSLLDDIGAEDLIADGDMLLRTRSQPIRRALGGGDLQRLHPALLHRADLDKIVAAVLRPTPTRSTAPPTDGWSTHSAQPKARPEPPTPIQPAGDRTLYERAIAALLAARRVDADVICLRLGIGYPQALDLLDQMTRDRIVSGPDADGERHLLVGSAA